MCIKGADVSACHTTSLSIPPGTSKPGASLDLERPTHTEGSEGAGSCLAYNPHMNLTLTQQRQRLPIFKVGHAQ